MSYLITGSAFTVPPMSPRRCAPGLLPVGGPPPPSAVGPVLRRCSTRSPNYRCRGRQSTFSRSTRVAPHGHADRNVTVLQDGLIDRVAIPADHVHEMPVTDTLLERAAERYAHTVERLAGRPPTLDVVHLGIGHDGHTASLVPGSDLLHRAVGSVAAASPYHGRRRMTLTIPVLSAARHVLWVVSGASKAPIVRRFIDSDPALPAVQVDRSGAVLLLDSTAAACLAHDTDISENA